MEKGLNKYWTPEKEAHFQALLESTTCFAERYMITMVGNVLKYDGRTREAKKATARLHLSLATASDDDLAEIVKLERNTWGLGANLTTDDRLKELVQLREKVKAKGIPRNLITRGKDA